MRLRVAIPGRAPRPGAAGAARVDAPQVVTVVLVAAVAAQLAVLGWKFVPGSARSAPPPPVAPASARPSFDPGTILAANLFGAAAAPTAPSGEAPRTNVALVLAGTIAATDPRQGLAIVGESGPAARVHAVGATLPGGVRLHEVYPDRIIIDRGGVLETLPLPRQSLAGGSLAPLPAPQAAATAGPDPSTDTIQQLMAQGPEVVGQVLRPMPDYQNGQLRGFRVYPGRDRQRFARLGLQPGDLVTAVNGVPLGDPQRGMEILRGIANAGTATVTVDRGGSAQQITVNASQIAAAVEDASAAPPPQPPPGGTLPVE